MRLDAGTTRRDSCSVASVPSLPQLAIEYRQPIASCTRSRSGMPSRKENGRNDKAEHNHSREVRAVCCPSAESHGDVLETLAKDPSAAARSMLATECE